LCPKCKGNSIVGKGKPNVWGCDHCNGEGKLDWIEVVVGKKVKFTWNVDYDFASMYPNMFTFENSTYKIASYVA